jgi:hypothetical protein
MEIQILLVVQILHLTKLVHLGYERRYLKGFGWKIQITSHVSLCLKILVSRLYMHLVRSKVVVVCSSGLAMAMH